MPERPDLRVIARNIREALGDYDREALLEILTHVFKEYVVEGMPKVMLGRADTVEDLAELSFPELIRLLQTRLSHPELELFHVEDDMVLVRSQGVLNPMTVDDVPRRASPAPVAPQAEQAEERAGVRVEEVSRRSASEAAERGRGDLLGGQRGVVQAPPPRPAPAPRRGLSINGRPQGASGGAPPPTASPTSRPSQPAPSAAASPPPAASKPEEKPADKPPEGDDAASIRFSLLELD